MSCDLNSLRVELRLFRFLAEVADLSFVFSELLNMLQNLMVSPAECFLLFSNAFVFL